MEAPTLLDLCCGAGGASMGYVRAYFDVTGVDIQPRGNYPFDFVRADALEYLAEYGKFYDVIHASPPCQRFSSKTRNKEKHPDLITPLRIMMQELDKPYIIENVPGSPLIDPIMLCGSSFGLPIRRHRLFESNVRLEGKPCDHSWQKPKYRVYDHGKWYLSKTVPVFGQGGGKAKEHWNEAMGIDWMNEKEIVEAIPPAYTEWIGRQLSIL